MPPDYSGQNLRGRSFKGQNLTGANFSKADIRGANFTNAILKDADFTGAKAGLQKSFVLFKLITIYLILVLSGCISAISSGLFIIIIQFIFSALNYTTFKVPIINDTIYDGFYSLVILILFIFLVTAITGGIVYRGLEVISAVTPFIAAIGGTATLAFVGGIFIALDKFSRIVERFSLEANKLKITEANVTKLRPILDELNNRLLLELNALRAPAFVAMIGLAILIFLAAFLANIIGTVTTATGFAITRTITNKSVFNVLLVLSIISSSVVTAIAFPGLGENLFGLIDRAFLHTYLSFEERELPSGITITYYSPLTKLIFRMVTAIYAATWTLLGRYLSVHISVENKKFINLHTVAIAFAATGGTSFRNADLTDADFTGATLKNTDFRKAKLTRTRFYEAKKLDFARVGDTILAKLAVLKLLVSGNGRGKSYAGANLKGANLIGADLKEANLKDAYISEATFQGACLEKANLTLTQAVNTDFTSAQMTGACVEAWNIESTTLLDNVDCRFVYLLEYAKPETDDRERRPSSGDFQPGEFTKLFEEVLNTVDLIFRNGIDWKAFVTAFQNVQAENEDTELALQSIENKGDGVVVVKVGVPDGADKEKIHSDFTQSYQIALQAVEEKYKAQLQAKDNEIVIYRQQSGEMTEIVRLLANKPINVQVDNKVENKNMTNSNDASRKIEIGSVGRDFNASGQALNLGEISGTVTNTINELPTSPKPEKPGIKELLTQLQATIEAETNLSEEDKAEALEQVKALAEAGKNPQEGAMQKTAKTAMKILKGTISGLPSAATLVEASGKLLPLITKCLGLG